MRFSRNFLLLKGWNVHLITKDTMEEEKTIKAYKGFNSDLTCRGFQYEIGKEYKTRSAKCCEKGFHACENPFDVLNYYPDIFSHRYCEVEQSGMIDKDDIKTASTRIKINAEIGFAGLFKAGIEWLKEVTNPAKVLENVKGETVLNDNGEHSAQIGSSGDYAKIGSSGYSAQIGSSGYSAQIGSSGDYAQIGSSGYSAQIGSSGYYAQIGSSGYYAQIGSSGYYAKIGSSGDSAQIDSTGEDSVIMCAGNESKVKAKKGSWITLAEWKFDEKKQRQVPVCVKTKKVDGKKIKADTWYRLENGKFVECE